MRTRPRGAAALLGALAGVTLSAGPAFAHPNVIAAGPLRAGEPARLTLIILGDEGAFHGADVTFPVSFRLTDARAIGPDLGTPAVDGQTVRLTGFDLPAGRIGQIYIDGTPTTSGELSVTVVSHLDSGKDYDYPPLVVQVGGKGGSSWTGKAGPAALIAGAGALVTAAYLFRRRHRRP
ncbi:MAG TPA: hypothetical protein VHE83_06015 [Mycobacteriales bacterium]|nr:hypothetical protein [Mycobacteriales bacterium]